MKTADYCGFPVCWSIPGFGRFLNVDRTGSNHIRSFLGIA